MLCYIHVPFCKTKCIYCGFASQVANTQDMQTYLDCLLREIALQGDALAAAEQATQLSSIYFGGGTPSLLPAKAVEAILTRLERAFGIEPHAEITVEVNPESALVHHLHDLVGLGIKRMSIGLQALDDASLRDLGRCHTARHGVEAVRNARLAGVRNLSLDLIWGRPGQRVKTWLDELKQVLDMTPEHLSCYGLTIEPGTVLEAKCLANEVTLPIEDEQGKMFIYGSELLEAAGYLHYEISNFARLGFQSRHNMGYWEGRDFLGLGPAAVSTIAGWRWGNSEHLSQWADAVSTGAIGRGSSVAQALTPEERLQEMIMLRLRTSRGLHLRGYKRLTGRSFTQEHAAHIQALAKHELIRMHGGYLRLTRQGWLVADAILANLCDW